MKKYEEIYHNLLSLIQSNTIKAGELLPSELNLCNEYKVSRDTVRKALLQLERTGYIQKSHGKGSIVLDINRFDFPVSGLSSFKEIASNFTNKVETIVHKLELKKADEKIAKEMQLNKNDKVWYIERIRKIDGEAVILDIDIINASIIEHLDKNILEDSLYNYIENTLNLKIGYAQKEITCSHITKLDKKTLDTKNYSMVVQVNSFVFLEDTRLFQHTISRHRPDKFIFRDFARRMQINK